MIKQILTKMLVGLCLLAALPGMAAPGKPVALNTAQLMSRQNAAPLLFMENRGQVADVNGKPRPDILFTANSNDTRIFLSATGISYQFSKVTYPNGYTPIQADLSPTAIARQAELESQIVTQTFNFTLTLEGANPHPKIIRQDKSATEQHFYLTQCPDGINHVSGYHKIVYEEIYPNIDWVVYSNGSHLKYDFLVKAGGDSSLIKLRIKDAEEASLTKNGELMMKTSLGTVKENAPVSYANGHVVKSRFRRNGDGTIGFEVAAPENGMLRIDPSVVWNTYLGGSGNDIGVGCTADAAGNIYLSGYTNSPTGIASGGLQTTLGGSTDVFLAKFDSSGYLLWSTYYGNSGSEIGAYTAVDASGNVYLCGQTSSTTGIASGGYQNTLGGGTDQFLIKFDASGSRIWSTYFGGPGNETFSTSRAIAIDATGNIYLAGGTASTSGIASGGFQNTYGTGSSDAFLTKFNAAGSLLWSTYYGGTSSESAGACAVDASGNVYLGGSTQSSAGIASGGFLNTYSGTSSMAYLAKFNAAGNRIWGTYYGSGNNDQANACVVDASGNIYLGGSTASTTGIASGGFQNTYGGSLGDCFIVKFNAAGSRIWGTYYGGSGQDQLRGLALSATGNLYVSLFTNSTNAISLNGFQNTISGGNDGGLAEVSAAGSLVWGSYFGGTGSDNVYSITTDAHDNIYMAGQLGASTTRVILPGTYQSTYGGGSSDAFLLKVGTPGLFTDTTITSALCAGASLNIPFTLFGTYNTGNTFTAQLSNAAGSFASPVNIGTLSGTAAGTIAATIPAGTPTGAGYRIRVISSNPGMIAPNNGTDLTINNGNASVAIAAVPATPVCAGTTVTFTATPTNGGTAPAYQWFRNGTAAGTNSPTYTSNALANNDVVYAVITGNATCANTPDTSNKITMVVNPATVPTVTIAASPGNTVCVGSNVTFTATPVNGGATPVYQWKKNGVNVGTSSPTYTDNALATGDVITLSLTSNAACTSTTPVSSNSITMTINNNVTPTVAIAANPGNTICAGTAVTFTATPTNGGAAPVYQWKKGTTVVGTNSSTYTSNTLASGDVITVTMTSNAPCASTTPVVSTGITMTVNPTITPTVTIAANPGNTICAGTSVTFTATPVNGGTAPVYQWKNGTTVVGTNSPTYTSNTLANGNVITVTMTSNAACASATPATSTGITMTVNPAVTPSVTVLANPGTTICAGTPVTFTATPVNGGSAPVYQWTKGATVVGTNSNTYTDNALVSGDVITASLTSNASCASSIPATAATTMNVTPALVPTVTIAASPGNTICAGATVTFSATPVNGGSTPVYQWRNNGITVGTTNTYTSNTLNDQDTILCILGSSATCVTTPIDTSNVIIMKVNTTVAPTVTITANPGTSVSSGTLVTFTAVVLNGGTTTLYEWKKNGVVVSTNATYATSTLVNRDTITCSITGNNPCATSNTASSNPLIMNISTGIAHVGSAVSDLQLYPNPNNGSFTIEASAANNQDVVIEVMNAVGQLIYQQQAAVINGRINVPVTLPEQATAKGVYMMRIRTHEGIDVMRFLLTK